MINQTLIDYNTMDFSQINKELNSFIKKINLVLITHGFGKQTQFIESLLDGHSEIIQFPTNYKDYFLNFKSQNFYNAIDEFIYSNPGYVYDIFNVHKNKYVIINKSRIVPMIEDRDYFYFDEDSLSEIKKDEKLKKYYFFIKRNLRKKFKKKFIFENKIIQEVKNISYLGQLYTKAKPVYKLDHKKFKKIYLKIVSNKKFNLKYNKKNLLILLHFCLAKYFKKNIKKVKYILFNLHDYTNTEELINNFIKSHHIAVAQDFKTQYSRNSNKIGTHHQSVVEFCYTNLIYLDKMLKTFELKKKRNYLFFNEYIERKKNKFVKKILNNLKLNFEDICIKPTYMAKPSFGNSRNNKVLQSFSKDFKYYDWWNYLSEKEIFFLDYFFRSFFNLCELKQSKIYKMKTKKESVFIYFRILKNFFISDYRYLLMSEIKTQKQFNKSSLSYFSYYRLIRTPLKLFLYTLIYPIIFFYKIYRIELINKEYKNKKIRFKIYK